MVKLHRAQEDALFVILILECSVGIIWSSGDKYTGQHKVESVCVWGLLSHSWTVLFKCGENLNITEKRGISPQAAPEHFGSLRDGQLVLDHQMVPRLSVLGERGICKGPFGD